MRYLVVYTIITWLCHDPVPGVSCGYLDAISKYLPLVASSVCSFVDYGRATMLLKYTVAQLIDISGHSVSISRKYFVEISISDIDRLYAG